MKFAQIPFSVNDSPEHRKLALEAAGKSMVLLKNDGVLPLKKAVTVAVVGPNATSLAAIEGNYNAVPSAPVLPLAGMDKAFGAGNGEDTLKRSPYVNELSLSSAANGVASLRRGSAFRLERRIFRQPGASGNPRNNSRGRAGAV